MGELDHTLPFAEDVAVLRNLQLSHRGDVLLVVPDCPTPHARARDQHGHDRTLCLQCLA